MLYASNNAHIFLRNYSKPDSKRNTFFACKINHKCMLYDFGYLLFAHFLSFVKISCQVKLAFTFLKFLPQNSAVADCNYFSSIRRMYLGYHIFTFTGSFAQHTEHFKNSIFSSFTSFVSGLLHSLHITKSLTYWTIFSFILEAGIFVPIMSPWGFRSAGAASSLRMYFWNCSIGLARVWAICSKLLITVLFPCMWPLTLGTSNSDTSFDISGSSFLPLVSISSYSISIGNKRPFKKLWKLQQPFQSFPA